MMCQSDRYNWKYLTAACPRCGPEWVPGLLRRSSSPIPSGTVTFEGIMTRSMASGKLRRQYGGELLKPKGGQPSPQLPLKGTSVKVRRVLRWGGFSNYIFNVMKTIQISKVTQTGRSSIQPMTQNFLSTSSAHPPKLCGSLTLRSNPTSGNLFPVFSRHLTN